MRHFVSLTISVPSPTPEDPQAVTQLGFYPPILLDLFSVVAVEDGEISRQLHEALTLWNDQQSPPLDISSLPLCVARVHCEGAPEVIHIPHVTTADIHGMILEATEKLGALQKQAQEDQIRRIAAAQAAQQARQGSVLVPQVRIR